MVTCIDNNKSQLDNMDEIKNDILYETIECLNRECIESSSSKEFLCGRKILNIWGSIRSLSFHKLLKAWIKTYRVRKTFALKKESSYQYGEYPSRNIRFCVYTCITGGYDNLLPIHCFAPNIDYVAFTDNVNIVSNGWEVRPLPKDLDSIESNVNKNRYMKMHPDVVGDYDYAIYVDGLVEIYSNLTNMINVINPLYGIAIHNHFFRNCIFDEIKFFKINRYGNPDKMNALASSYEEQGFPHNYGVLECTMILTDLHNEKGKRILDDWWNEHLKQDAGRDQLTLPYVLWKQGIAVSEIGTLGNNVKTNPKIRVRGHKKYNNIKFH